jgi:RNA polymerase sigma factor (sigma-70 family)
MDTTPLAAALRRLAGTARAARDTDRQLLGRFARGRDEAAFAELVRRHGPLVLGVCRCVLGRVDGAEDAFQATFLVLARKARSVAWRESVGNWLHETAYRLARKLRAEDARRRARERAAAEEAGRGREAPAAWRALWDVVDAELRRLPRPYRAPLLACYLEDRTQDEAAAHLGWPLRTFQRRLARGRELLRARLERLGVPLPAALLAGGWTAAAVPQAAAASVARGAAAFAGGGAASVSGLAALLASGATRAGASGRVLLTSTFVAAVGLCMAVTVLLPGSNQSPSAAGKAGALPPPAADADALPAGAIARLGSLRLRHTGDVYAIAFAGGKTVLAGDDRGFLVEWDIATDHRVRQSRPFASAANPVVYSVAASADGKTTAVGGDGAVVMTSAGHTRTWKVESSVRVLALSTDGSVCAAGGPSQDFKEFTVGFYDAATGRERCRVSGKERIDTFAMDGAGRFCAALRKYDKVVRLFDAETGKPAGTLEADESVFVDVALAPDGKTAATTGEDSQLRIWDLATRKEIRHAREANWRFNVAYLPDGKVMARRYDSRLAVLDPATGGVLSLGEIMPGRGELSLVVSPDGRTAASVSAQMFSHTFDVYDLASGKPRRYEGHRKQVSALAFSADGKALFSAGMDQVVRWDTEKTGEGVCITGREGGACDLALSPDGALLGMTDVADVRLWELASRKERLRWKMPGGGGPFGSIAFGAPGGSFLTTELQTNQTAYLWEPGTGDLLRAILIGADWPVRADLSPDGKFVAAAGYRDGSVRFWDAATGAELPPLAAGRKETWSVVFSPDGRLLATGGGDGDVCLWEFVSRKLVRRLRQGGTVGALAFSADGQTLLSGGSDGARLWDVSSGEELTRFQGHECSTSSVALSPDGRFAATGGADTTVLLWDLWGKRPVGNPPGEQELAGWWADLTDVDARRAYAAVGALASTPRQVVPFLAGRLPSIPPLDARTTARVAALLTNLDGDDFAARERAFGELRKIGPASEPLLRKALSDGASPELRRRIEALVKSWQESPPDRRRTARALEVLERIGSPDARGLLAKLAAGVPEARLTREAKVTLGRLERRP